MTRSLVSLVLALSFGCATVGGGPPSGGEEKPDSAEQAAMKAVGAKAPGGMIVWSSSRLGNHDLFVMDTDGSNVHAITKGEEVDWFPRFSPDGAHILFTRSKKGWVFERDANAEGKWDIHMISPDGEGDTKVVDDASWGGWISNDEIVYVRATRIYRRKLAAGSKEKLLVDSSKVPALDGALLQQPEMSKDGKYIAITLRGSKRETGVWNLADETWTRTGDGCQINWTPDGHEVYWVHPTGNGGSRVLHMPMASGKAKSDSDDLDAMTLIDIPGRRSHEYFPELSADGKLLVWAATQRGHDHDIADYEIYLWKVGDPAETAARLTFHSANDRWPDIFLPSQSASASSASSATSEPAEKTSEEDAGDDSSSSQSALVKASATADAKSKPAHSAKSKAKKTKTRKKK